MKEEEKKVIEILDELGIQYEKHDHPPVFTVEEAVAQWKTITGAHSKNIFVRNKKGNQHYLIIVEHEKRVDLTLLSKRLGQSRFSFASPERIKKYLGVEPGSVSPFGLINDASTEVEVIIDSDLKSAKQINFHPNVNTATLTISFVDFTKFLEHCGNQISYMSL
jgi:Ala-tRNA(Pro) deacylase